MRIISRAEWGARPPTRPPARDDLPWPRVWLHHSAGRMGGAAEVQAIQRDHQSRGWRDIAYSIVVAADGVYEGMGIGNRHLNSDAGYSGTILLVGNFETHALPESMVDATAWAVAHGLLAGWWLDAAAAVPHLTGGHRDVPGAKPTACPGRYAHAAIPEINRRAAQMIYGLASPPPSDPFTEEDPVWFVLHDSAPNQPTSNVHWLVAPTGKARVLKDPGPYLGVFEKKSVPYAGRVLADLGYTIKS